MSTTEPLDPPAGLRFSETVRSATTADHEHAAASGFMAELFDRALPREAYTSMIAQHWFAYVQLERAADRWADHPVAGAFVWEELRRVPALEADLHHLMGEDWRDRIEPGDATRRYCERMSEVCRRPETFVAHHYTRYMGDLSGGQVIGRIAREVYALEPAAGAAFYEFPAIDDVRAFKDEYRRRLDRAAFTPSERQRLLAEVAVAYRCNTEVFEDLDRELRGGDS